MYLSLTHTHTHTHAHTHTNRPPLRSLFMLYSLYVRALLVFHFPLSKMSKCISPCISKEYNGNENAFGYNTNLSLCDLMFALYAVISKVNMHPAA